MDLYIDEEFKGLLPDLTDPERKELEKQILRDGVLNPIIVWNRIIVDGHNRYMICKMNGITNFPVKEMKFENRDDAIEWILRHQLGRRNLTDFQRTRIALRYEEMIAKKAKERQRDAGGDRKSDEYKKNASVPRNITDTHTTRDEIAKIAGTSGSTVMRTKYILENGTEEQIARAEKGGVELDGRRNSIRAIEREIKEEKGVKKDVNETVRICCDCGKEKPITEFPSNGEGGYRKYCLECKKFHNIGEAAKKYIEDLHDYTKEIEYTASDLEEEVRENIKPCVSILESALEQHTELLDDSDCRSRIRNVLQDIVNEIQRIMEERCYE